MSDGLKEGFFVILGTTYSVFFVKERPPYPQSQDWEEFLGRLVFPVVLVALVSVAHQENPVLVGGQMWIYRHTLSDAP